MIFNSIVYIYYELAFPSLAVDWKNNGTGTSLDLVGACTIRLGDKKEYLFLGGGINQPDVILTWSQEKEAVVPILTLPKPKNMPTTCAASAYLVNDRESKKSDSNPYLEDLVIGRFDGVYLLTQIQPGVFESKKIHHAKKNETPVSVALGDYNKSSRLSIFIANYASPGFVAVMTFGTKKTADNYLLRNDGFGNFVDVTEEAGVIGNRNSWTACFVDLTNTGSPDIVVANDEGPVDIYKNNGGGKFEKMASSHIGYWMGIAVGDFNNSGRASLFLTNVGTHTTGVSQLALRLVNKLPKFPKGYTTKHLLLENVGNYEFKDHLLGDSSLFPKGGNTQFGWGAIFTDLNFDGNLDLLYSTGWKFLPWNRFYATRESAVSFSNTGSKHQYKFQTINNYPNKEYSQSPLVLDLKGDGVPQLVWINHSVKPKIYQLKKKNAYNIHIYHLSKTAENANKTIVLETNDGKKQSRQLVLGGSGLGVGESSQYFFGMGESKFKKLKII